MESWPSVVVVGPGAVGAYYGGMLARAGASVTLLGRPDRPSEHLEAIARSGLQMNTVSFEERVAIETSTRPETVAGADLILFAVKTLDTETAGAQIAPHLAEGSILVDLQNGVDNPEQLRAIGIDPVPAVVYVAAAIERSGEIKHRGRGDLVIGHPRRRQDLERVKAWLERADIGCRISDDVDRELWVKLILNSMANAISALAGKSYGQLVRFEPTWKIAEAVAREGVAVARACGHDVDEADTIQMGIDVCRNVGEATSSTQQDIARGRLTEIDALNGTIARHGATHGIATPVNETLWALVKLREQ